MARKKLLVIGPSSLVGSHFVETFSNKYEISGLGRTNIFGSDKLAPFNTVDIQDKSNLIQAVKDSSAEVVINYAAETNVDGCEAEREKSDGRVYLTNAAAVGWMAEACKETGKIFYQISTDFVFDGTQGPYSENDTSGLDTNKIGWYGYTKHLGERELIERLPHDNCIVRISYPYRARFKLKSDFARNILDLYQKGMLFPLFTDQLFSPTLIDDVSSAIDFLIAYDARGTYHVASRDVTSPFKFGSNLLSIFFAGFTSTILTRGLLSEFNKLSGRAPRPVRGGLKTDKIARLGFTPRSTEEGISELFRQMK